MSEVVLLKAEIRTRAGKGGARAQRREGRVPAIIYGNKQEPTMVAVDANQLALQLRRPGFMTHVFELDFGAQKERVLPRDVQHDPVSDAAVHIDFMRFSSTTRVTVDVEIRFENEDKSPGLKKGGVLNIASHTLSLICSPDGIPEFVGVDLSGMEIGDVVHRDTITLPRDVELAPSDAQETIASITAPTSESVAEEAVASEGETA